MLESSLNKRLERSLERVTELERQLTNTASVKETVSSENEALKVCTSINCKIT